MNYTYTLGGVSVSPIVNWDIDFKRNKGQIFYRRIINGDFIFQGDDYEYLITLDVCSEPEFIIYCEGEEFWTGKFIYPYGFEFDEDKCIATSTPQVVDEYSCIMDNYETEWYLEDFINSLLTNPPSSCVYPVVTVTNCGGVPLFNLGGGAAGEPISLRCMLLCLFQGTNGISGITFMDCDLDIVSSFFYLDNFPNGDVYATYYGTNNYVTGAANRLQGTLFHPNTKVRQDLGGTACPEQNDKIGFKTIETWLRNRFNAYWYIDENGKFRIEHVSFFLPGFAHSEFGNVGIDLTSLSYKGETYAERHNKYEYLTDELFDQEVFTWQHYWGTESGVAHGLDFQGEPIYYGATANAKYECVPGEFKEKDWATPDLWTDIDWAAALANPDDINCNGWLMICADWDEVAAFCNMFCQVGDLTGVNGNNRDFSTANLMEDFFTWERIFISGTMNGSDATPVVDFDSQIRKKLQEEITFPWCCEDEYDPMKAITTELGNGLIYSATYDGKSLKVQLLYD